MHSLYTFHYSNMRYIVLRSLSLRIIWITLYIGFFVVVFLVLFIYLFIYLAAPGLSCSTWALCCSTRDLFSCGMWALSCGIQGSSSLTGDRTQAPCIGSMETLTTGPPGKSLYIGFENSFCSIVTR